MESLFVAINVVLPICLLMLVGYLLRKYKIVKEETLLEMNKVVFMLLLPCVLMSNIMNTNIQEALQPKLIFYCIGSVLMTILLSMLLVPKFESNKKKQGVLVQAYFRSNFVLFGLPIIQSLYGIGNAGVTSVLIAIMVPIFNMSAVFVLQYYSQDKMHLKGVILGILKNPMVIGSFLGATILLSGIRLPQFALKTISDLSIIATPLALMILGGTSKWQAIKNNRYQIISVLSLRLILIPFIFICGAILLGYRQVELASILVLFASPVAVSSFSMAIMMKGDSELASQSVLVTTLFSIITIFIWVFLLTHLGLLF